MILAVGLFGYFVLAVAAGLVLTVTSRRLVRQVAVAAAVLMPLVLGAGGAAYAWHTYGWHCVEVAVANGLVPMDGTDACSHQKYTED